MDNAEETQTKDFEHENTEENVLPEKSNSALSILDEDDKKRSVVWAHFDKFADVKGVIWAKCQYCGSGKYNMSNGSSTGNLNRHDLTKAHLEKVDPSVDKQPFSNKVFCKKLSEWIVTDDQPFTVVKSPEFHALINICNPEANIPSAGTIKSDILKLYKNYKTNVQNILQNVPGKISFTLDGSHSGNNLASAFVTSLQEKKLLTKILESLPIIRQIVTLSLSHLSVLVMKTGSISIIKETIGEAKDEDTILEELQEKNTHPCETIPKLRRLIIKIHASP
ncbi:zinc finger BED domain-containing protein RICESLEEPER 2-like [Rhizophagus clarus]|uniref:Zinc finger BED domain-containing protein RICESLEEPER 2-like n=1 Tax=Rhizophagus clarus TaxID=94130 RepID=A0A8H3R5X8_9GLOM|nr:zinc finger BED domain-containing protein RICESLEEPER 2-like [Rhizophagus clarus]